MKKYALVFFFALFMSCNNLYANEKIVFIDINYIFNNSDAGKDLQAQIFSKNDNLQSQIKNYNLEIEDKKKKILSKKNVLSPEQYNLEVKNLDNEIKKVNETISQKRKELVTFKTLVENKFSININKIIEEFSEKNSIDIILNKENLLMAKKDLDITEKIFVLFNEKIKKININ